MSMPLMMSYYENIKLIYSFCVFLYRPYFDLKAKVNQEMEVKVICLLLSCPCVLVCIF